MRAQEASLQAVGAYLYVDTNGPRRSPNWTPSKTRYSVDLRTGRVTGPLSKTAKIIAPTLTLIP